MTTTVLRTYDDLQRNIRSAQTHLRMYHPDFFFSGESSFDSCRPLHQALIGQLLKGACQSFWGVRHRGVPIAFVQLHSGVVDQTDPILTRRRLRHDCLSLLNTPGDYLWNNNLPQQMVKQMVSGCAATLQMTVCVLCQCTVDTALLLGRQKMRIGRYVHMYLYLSIGSGTFLVVIAPDRQTVTRTRCSIQ